MEAEYPENYLSIAYVWSQPDPLKIMSIEQAHKSEPSNEKGLQLNVVEMHCSGKIHQIAAYTPFKIS